MSKVLKQCPQCERLSVEYDSHHQVEKCLNRQCGWVNRSEKPLESTFKIPPTRLGIILEQKMRAL